MRLRCSCLLPCSMDRLASELGRPALFHYLASPMLVFDAVEPADASARWSPGKYRFRLRLGGRTVPPWLRPPATPPQSASCRRICILIMVDAPGCVGYYPGWIEDADRLFRVLEDEIDWEQHAITLYGRTRPTPRLTSWIGDSAYRYSGIVNEPAPCPKALAELQERLRRELGVDFNSCLANLYRDGTDSMGYHSDNEPELGPRPTIASVSLGDRRRFVLRHRATRERWNWDLGHGDLLLMRDESQSDYAHAVPKTARPVGRRMNLTFRCFRTT